MSEGYHTRRGFLKIAGFGGAATALQGRAASAANKKPNFVFILVDDLGWIDTTCYGSRFYETPNIDRLAAGGMRFTGATLPKPNPDYDPNTAQDSKQ